MFLRTLQSGRCDDIPPIQLIDPELAVILDACIELAASFRIETCWLQVFGSSFEFQVFKSIPRILRIAQTSKRCRLDYLMLTEEICFLR